MNAAVTTGVEERDRARSSLRTGSGWISPPRVEKAASRAAIFCKRSRQWWWSASKCSSLSTIHPCSSEAFARHSRTKSNSSLGHRPLCEKHLAQMSAYLLYGFVSSGETPSNASATLSMIERVCGVGGGIVGNAASAPGADAPPPAARFGWIGVLGTVAGLGAFRACA